MGQDKMTDSSPVGERTVATQELANRFCFFIEGQSPRFEFPYVLSFDMENYISKAMTDQEMIAYAKKRRDILRNYRCIDCTDKKADSKLFHPS